MISAPIRAASDRPRLPLPHPVQPITKVNWGREVVAVMIAGRSGTHSGRGRVPYADTTRVTSGTRALRFRSTP